MTSYTSQSGFSLVETLVAITILMLIIVAPMTITSQTAKSSSFASEQVTAFFLAQEGVELVQKARDDLQIQYFSGDITDPWNRFVGGSSPLARCFAGKCGIEITDGSTNDISAPLDCEGSSNLSRCQLYRTDNNQRSRFTHVSSGNAATPFTRTITLTAVTPYEVKIVSRVTWRTGSIREEQAVEVEGRLFNVYGN